MQHTLNGAAIVASFHHVLETRLVRAQTLLKELEQHLYLHSDPEVNGQYERVRGELQTLDYLRMRFDAFIPEQHPMTLLVGAMVDILPAHARDREDVRRLDEARSLSFRSGRFDAILALYDVYRATAYPEHPADQPTDVIPAAVEVVFTAWRAYLDTWMRPGRGDAGNNVRWLMLEGLRWLQLDHPQLIHDQSRTLDLRVSAYAIWIMRRASDGQRRLFDDPNTVFKHQCETWIAVGHQLLDILQCTKTDDADLLREQVSALVAQWPAADAK